METEKTPGQVAYEAFMGSLTGRCPDVPVVTWERLDDLARDGYASGDTQADWTAAAQAVLDNRTPWGDANMVCIQQWPRAAIIRSGGPDSDVVKVIGLGGGELAYYDSVEEWERANP